MAAEKEVTACEFFMKTFVWMGRNPVEGYLLPSVLGVANQQRIEKHTFSSYLSKVEKEPRGLSQIA